MTQCSWQLGWRSLLLRAYDGPNTVDEFTTDPNPDQLIVLTTKGGSTIGVHRGGYWREARYEVGSLGMTAIGRETTLRWRGNSPITTLHLHIRGQTIRDAVEAVWDQDPQTTEKLDALKCEDPLIEQIMLALHQAVSAGAPDIYAESAAAFLAMHLLRKHAGFAALRPVGRDDSRLQRADEFLREHLSEPMSLDDLAAAAGMSKFHFVRAFKRTYGETPVRHLTLLRFERARRLLSDGEEQVTQIALSCGYDNPSAFASAFRRFTGVSPTSYRRQVR